MDPHSVPKDEITAALRTSRELGPDYDEAVAASLTQNIDQNLDERIRARIAEERDVSERPDPATVRTDRGRNTAIGVTAFFSLLFGAPASVAMVQTAGILGLALMWSGIVALNLIVFFAARR